jgi:hypothetical protein
MLHEIAVMMKNADTAVPVQLSTSPRAAINVLFSAHGVPKSYVLKNNDPYKRHIEHSVQLVCAEARRMVENAFLNGEKDMLWAILPDMETIASSTKHSSSASSVDSVSLSEEGNSIVAAITGVAGNVLQKSQSFLSGLRNELFGMPLPDVQPPAMMTSSSLPSTSNQPNLASSKSHDFDRELAIEGIPPSPLIPEGVNFHLAFQSRVGPIEWLRPYTDDKIKQLRAKRLIINPIAFVSEHIETLEEIDIGYRYMVCVYFYIFRSCFILLISLSYSFISPVHSGGFRELAEEYGLQQWGRVAAPNTHPQFISELAAIVKDALDCDLVDSEYQSSTVSPSLSPQPPSSERNSNSGTIIRRDSKRDYRMPILARRFGLKRSCSAECSAAYVDNVKDLLLR